MFCFNGLNVVRNLFCQDYSILLHAQTLLSIRKRQQMREASLRQWNIEVKAFRDAPPTATKFQSCGVCRHRNALLHVVLWSF